MQTRRRKVLRCRRLAAAVVVIATTGLLVTGQGVRAETAGVTRIIVPVPPGGALDILARLLGDQIGRSHGGAMVVEDRPGAGSIVGTELVSRAIPDGSTLLMVSPPAFTIIPHLRTLNYDALTSFAPICRLVRFPTVIAVRAASPYRTLADLMAAAEHKPGELTTAGIGPASLIHVGFEMLRRAAHVDMTFVPYPGPPPAVNALLGGQVTSYFGNYTDVAEHLRAGKLRVLAVATPSRIEPLPDVPTVAETGYAGYAIDGWFGLFAPAKTPKPIVARFAEWFSAAVQDADVKPKLLGLGLYPDNVCGADFASLVHKEYEESGAVIRDSGIKLSD